MKILHIAESAKGGVGTYLSEILPFQQEMLGNDGVRIIVPDNHASHLSGVDRHMIHSWRRRDRSIGALLRLAFAVRTEVRRFRPSIIHVHSSFAGAVVRLMYGWRKMPFVILYCPHGWGFERRTSALKNRVAAMIERTLADWCERIIVISEHERQAGLAIGIPEQKLVLILNGIADIAPARPSRWDDSRLKVLFVGRLDYQKGFDTLLDAIEPFAREIAVRVVGKAIAGPASARRGRSQVEYLGWRSLFEVASEIAAADVVAVPSRWEGFGLVALEAMRGGCAVVASNVGGLREIVVDGETGRLVPPDYPERLGHALSSGTREQWKAMGRAGRKRYLAHFTAVRLNRQLAQLYAEYDRTASVAAPEVHEAVHA
ncbi:MAG: glycosyltransferase family 1 protein [Sphingomonadales bacterium]|nr:glycosyltransferase family 1 protein [Sphingomonadales bacterium]